MGAIVLIPLRTDAQPVIVDVVTDTGNDTLKVGQPGSIMFTVDANGHNVAAATFAFLIHFSHGNIMGPMAEGSEVFPSPAARAAFESIAWVTQFGQGADPDTLYYGFIDFGGPLWDTSGEMWRITFTSSGPGAISFDTATAIVPEFQLDFADDLANQIPHDWRGDGKEIVVVEPEIVLRVAAHTGNDTLYAGLESAIVVSLEGDVDSVCGGSFYAEWQFTNGNVVGQLGPPDNPEFSTRALDAFESISVQAFRDGTDSVTTFITMVDFGAASWVGTGELFRFTFVPADSGHVHFDFEANSGPPDWITILDPCGAAARSPVIDTPGITTIPCGDGGLSSGDANFDRIVNAADIIYLVGHVFKSGPEPVIWNLGDVNCDDAITAADIVHLVGHVFKSGAEPCDVCSDL